MIAAINLLACALIALTLLACIVIGVQAEIETARRNDR